jgi:hypothetical protein
MKRTAVAAVCLLGASLSAGCGGRIDSATNVTQSSATLNAHFTCTREEAGEYWLAHRRVGATGAWSETGRRGFNCTTAAMTEQRAYQLTGLSAGTTYEARVCADPVGSQPVVCADADGTVHGAGEDSRTRSDVTYFTFATLTSSLPSVGPAGPPPPPSGLPIKRRVCMNTHMHYTNAGTPYSDVGLTKSRLDYLGSDCVRDFMTTNVTAQASRFNRLDVDVIAMCGGFFTTWQWEGNEASCVAQGDAAITRLVAIEGMNEPYRCNSAQKPEWDRNQTRIRNHMVRIRDAALPRGLDAYSVGACRPEWYTLAPIPGIVNNSHSYAPQGQYPTLSSLDGWIARTRFGDLGYASTEMGTYNPLTNGEGFMAGAQLVTALDHLYRGAKRFAIYELQDWGAGGEDFGFWSFTGTKRRAADAMHNLLALLGEARTGPTVGFTYTASDPANRVLHLSARAPDGTQYIALWNHQSTAARIVSLRLSASRPVTIVRPVNSPTGENRAASTAHAVLLGDDPLIAIIRP